MIRKTIIVVLALAAVGTTAVAIVSYTKPVCGTFSIGERIRVVTCCDIGYVGLRWCPVVKGPPFFPGSDNEETAVKLTPVRMRIELVDRGLLPVLVRFFASPDTEHGGVAVWAWLVIVATSTYPTIAFIRGPWRRYRRRKKGLCLKCGYDLTGNESGTCPECGAAI